MRFTIALLLVASAALPNHAAVISDHTSVAEFDQIPIELLSEDAKHCDWCCGTGQVTIRVREAQRELFETERKT